MKAVRSVSDHVTAHAAEQRERILRSAIPLVAERGADNVRLRDVSVAAGVSIGTLQHYFTTRDGLLLEAFSYHSMAIIAELNAVGHADDPWKRLETLYLTLSNSEQFRQRCVVWLEFAGAASRDATVRAMMNRVYEEWRVPVQAAICEGAANGLFKPVMPAAEITDTVLAVIDGFELAHAIELSSATPAAIQRRLLAVTKALLGV